MFAVKYHLLLFLVLLVLLQVFAVFLVAFLELSCLLIEFSLGIFIKLPVFLYSLLYHYQSFFSFLVYLYFLLHLELQPQSLLKVVAVFFFLAHGSHPPSMDHALDTLLTYIDSPDNPQLLSPPGRSFPLTQ